MPIFESAHDKALLEAWIGEHKGIQTVSIYDTGVLSQSKWQRAPIWASDIERQFKLPNASSILIFKNGTWEHRSHIGVTAKKGLGMGALITYLDSLKMPLEDARR